MEKIAEPSVRKFAFEEFSKHLQVVVEALADNNNISVMLQRRGDEVFVFCKKRYSDEVYAIYEEAKREYQRRKQQGYSREQAFEDFMKAQDEISKYLRDDEIL